jgi:hypothetical protein
LTDPVSLAPARFSESTKEQTTNVAALELLLCEEHKQTNATSPDVMGENCT